MKPRHDRAGVNSNEAVRNFAGEIWQHVTAIKLIVIFMDDTAFFSGIHGDGTVGRIGNPDQSDAVVRILSQFRL